MTDTLAIFHRAHAVHVALDARTDFQRLWNELEDDIHELPPSTLADLRAVTARYLTDTNALWKLRIGAMVLNNMLDY